jgi:hypothetical protein
MKPKIAKFYRDDDSGILKLLYNKSDPRASGFCILTTDIPSYDSTSGSGIFLSLLNTGTVYFLHTTFTINPAHQKATDQPRKIRRSLAGVIYPALARDAPQLQVVARP